MGSSQCGTKILVGVPCYNEAETIGQVVKQISLELSEFADLIILVVDDGSDDETASKAEKAGAEVIRHKQNRGLGSAFKVLHTHALRDNYDFLLTIDGDSQFLSSDARSLLDHCLTQGTDFASGSRFMSTSNRINMPLVKRIGNFAMARLVSRLTGHKLTDAACGLRVYSRKCLASINPSEGYTYTQETLIDIASFGNSMEEMPITVNYFHERKSRVASSLVRYGLKTSALILQTQLRVMPGYFYGSLSAISGGLAVLFGAVFASNYLITGQFSGYLFAGFLAGFFSLIAILFFQTALIANQQSKTDLLIRTALAESRLRR